jgi:hypothetical protein
MTQFDELLRPCAQVCADQSGQPVQLPKFEHRVEPETIAPWTHKKAPACRGASTPINLTEVLMR